MSLSESQVEQPALDLHGWEYMMWYGINAIINGVTPGVIYIIFAAVGGAAFGDINNYYYIVISQTGGYIPVLAGWLAIAIFDSDFTRILYKAVLSLSIASVFVGNIVGFAMIFVEANNWDYGRVMFWILWPLYLVYEVGQMLMQFLLLPGLFEYLEAEPIQGKDEENEPIELLAIM